MTYIEFVPRKFQRHVDKIINMADEILTEYQQQGYVLTVRQLYYQFVARGVIENTERSYSNLVNWMTDARLAGRISWDALEDRNRKIVLPFVQDSIASVFDEFWRYWAEDYWRDQDYHVEVWVEKDALIGVVERPANRFRLPHIACRGYMSASAHYEAGKRFDEAQNAGKHCVILHLGDHDPSGVDMTRDNRERAELMSGYDVEVRRLALNMDQVRQYNPPPNPTKITDSRAGEYIANFGHTCWELDALRPQVIDDLIDNAIREYVNWDRWNAVKEREQKARDEFRTLETNIDSVMEYVRTIKGNETDRRG